MATCITKARSNYFSVTDVPAFLTMMQKWEKDFGIRIMKKRIDEDQTVYAFSYETTSVNINGALCYGFPRGSSQFLIEIILPIFQIQLFHI